VKKIFAIVLLSLLVSLIGCSNLKVVTDYNKSTNFGDFKTFRVHEGKTIPGDELVAIPLIRKRSLAVTIEELKSKGFEFTTNEDADFVVALHAGHKDRMEETKWDNYDFYDPWQGKTGGRIVVSTTDEITIVFDFVNPKNRNLIWRGMGTGFVEEGTGHDTDKLRSLIREILEDFPPGR
jgi:hypothetical protein